MQPSSRRRFPEDRKRNGEEISQSCLIMLNVRIDCLHALVAASLSPLDLRDHL